MYTPEYNNFSKKSIYEIDRFERDMKKSKNVVIDLSGTKYDLLRTITQDFEWYQLEQKSETKNYVWNIKWYDYYINEDDLRRMYPY
jgi:tubulin polyglutamylase TTLL6/13